MQTIALMCEGDTYCVECADYYYSDYADLGFELQPVFSIEDWRFFEAGCDVLACMGCSETLDVMHDDSCEHVTDAVSPGQLYDDCVPAPD